MRIPGLSHLRLMEESEARLAAVASDGSPTQAQVATRLLHDTRLYQRWHAEHDRLMRAVSCESRGLAQASALRRTSFGLVHRKAMFEYLRQEKVTGRDRHAVFSLVFGEHDYATAVLQEHSNYMRSAASLMCAHHLGFSVLDDRAFADPLSRYEQLYSDYFRSFCGTALAGDQYSSGDTLRTLLPYLKRQLSELRRLIVAMPHESCDGFQSADFTPENAANTQRMYRPFRAA